MPLSVLLDQTMALVEATHVCIDIHVYAKPGAIRHTGFFFTVRDEGVRSMGDWYRADYGPHPETPYNLFASSNSSSSSLSTSVSRSVSSSFGVPSSSGRMLQKIVDVESVLKKEAYRFVYVTAVRFGKGTWMSEVETLFYKDPNHYALTDENCRKHCKEVFGRLAASGYPVSEQAQKLIRDVVREDFTGAVVGVGITVITALALFRSAALAFSRDEDNSEEEETSSK